MAFQRIVEFGVEWMLDQSLHRAGYRRKVVRENRIERQIAGHHDLPGERHDGAAEIVGLYQRMGHKARLGATGTVTVAEYDHRQIVIPHEPGDPVVDCRHGEQRACAFLGLHATG